MMDRSSSSSLCDEIVDLGGIIHPSFDDDANIYSGDDSPSDDNPFVGGVETAKVVTEGDLKPPHVARVYTGRRLRERKGTSLCSLSSTVRNVIVITSSVR